MTNLHESNLILEALGQRQFRTATGAYDYVYGPVSVSFRLPGKGINFVRIVQTPDHSYTMTFSRLHQVRGLPKFTDIAQQSGIQLTKLRSVFMSETGLDVS